MLKKKTKSAASFTPIRFGLLCVAILGCLGLLLVRVGWLQIISPITSGKTRRYALPARRTRSG